MDEDQQERYNIVREMLLVFVTGGALGVLVLVAAITFVEFLK